MNRFEGILQSTDQLDLDELAALAQRYESLGYRSIWLPDFFGRELVALSSFILSKTERVRVTTGIANIYARDAMSQAQAAHTLNEIYGGRFNLGLGVSHPIGAQMRGQIWENPVEKMTNYLQLLRETRANLPEPFDTSPIYIASHGPKMLKVAAEYADGANTYLMPPDHTTQARKILGGDKTLTVTLPCCLTSDQNLARTIGRKALSIYMPLGAYQRAWNTWGYGDELDGGGSDRFIDAMVAWGNSQSISERIGEYLDAGADQVIMIPYNPDGGFEPPWDLLEAFSPQEGSNG